MSVLPRCVVSLGEERTQIALANGILKTWCRLLPRSVVARDRGICPHPGLGGVLHRAESNPSRRAARAECHTAGATVCCCSGKCTAQAAEARCCCRLRLQGSVCIEPGDQHPQKSDPLTANPRHPWRNFTGSRVLLGVSPAGPVRMNCVEPPDQRTRRPSENWFPL